VGVLWRMGQADAGESATRWVWCVTADLW